MIYSSSVWEFICRLLQDVLMGVESDQQEGDTHVRHTDSGALMKTLVRPSWNWSWSILTDRRRWRTPCFSSPRHVGHDSLVKMAYLERIGRDHVHMKGLCWWWCGIYQQNVTLIPNLVQLVAGSHLTLSNLNPVAWYLQLNKCYLTESTRPGLDNFTYCGWDPSRCIRVCIGVDIHWLYWLCLMR